jgi:hydroxymethylglutaryl-CoA synthase
MANIGVSGMGVYLPRYRISKQEYKKCWGTFPCEEKTVLNYDEDVITMGVEAAKQALTNGGCQPENIEGVFVASTSFPYVEKTVVSTIAQACGFKKDIFNGAFSGSAQAGTAALLSCSDFVQNRGKAGLVIISDALKGLEGDPLGPAFAAGAVAILVSRENTFMEIGVSAGSYLELLGERFRRDQEKFADDLELRAYHKEGSQQAILAAARAALQKIEDGTTIDKVIFPVKDGKSSLRLAKKLDFTEQQVFGPKIFQKIGDTGVCDVFMELLGCLAETDGVTNILLVSYGSGACSNAIVFKAREVPQYIKEFNNYLEDKGYIDYLTYLKRLKLIGVN